MDERSAPAEDGSSGRARCGAGPAFLWLALALPALAPRASAQLELPAVFGDGAVLQRDAPIAVWGRAATGEELRVALADHEVRVRCDAGGDFRVELPALPAGGPHELVVEGARERLVRRDLWVGEVWLGCGQSNLVMTLYFSLGYEEALERAELPLLRTFVERSGPAEEPQWRGAGEWVACSAETCGDFSAVLFFLGRRLHEELGVPVGLIQSSMSNSSIQKWTRAGPQRAHPVIGPHVERWESRHDAFEIEARRAEFQARLEEWEREATLAQAAGRELPPRPRNPVERHLRQGAPGGLFNGKIAPLVGYGLRGVVWYQGEANTPGAELYEHQLPLLVRDWRELWGDEALPFAWVQLPNFADGREEHDWPRLRESQRRALTLPCTGMAVAIDVGDPIDIHPVNKQPVGERLAAWALGDVYCRDVVPSGPLYRSHERRGAFVLVDFDHVDGGLVVLGPRLEAFELRDESGEWHPAWADVRGDRVVVSCPGLERPTAVRYGWSKDPLCYLVNGHGLPAAPFTSE